MADPRLKELDALRGLAVAVMILVVSPGSWAHTYAPLQHADWHGWTFADLVFPDFLFGVGMALALTLGRSLDPFRDRTGFGRKLVRRVTGLIGLGLVLNFFCVIAGWLGAASVGPTDTVEWRLPGVLQRIALCYLLAVAVVSMGLLWRPRQPASSTIIAAVLGIGVLLVGYWAVLTYVAAPGYESGDLSKAGNLSAWIDRAVFTPRHMWPLGAETWRGPVVYEPEGLLSTLPATANVLFGFLAATVWRQFPDQRDLLLLAIGLALLISGLLLDAVFPINKKLWTSSFVLLTSGISCLALLCLALLLRTRAIEDASYPLFVLGGNALLAFALSAALSAFGGIPLWGGQTAQSLGFALVNRWITDPYIASLVCALGIVAVITLAILPLHRRGLHLSL